MLTIEQVERNLEFAKNLNVLMFVSGREWTEDHYAALLEDVGTLHEKPEIKQFADTLLAIYEPAAQKGEDADFLEEKQLVAEFVKRHGALTHQEIRESSGLLEQVGTHMSVRLALRELQLEGIVKVVSDEQGVERYYHYSEFKDEFAEAAG